ncbi:MAG: 5-oxoprolinase subunit PxpA [Bacillota bacterium]|nr:5-oxoprolinase subunit PxpA [Bacillota bacterium]
MDTYIDLNSDIGEGFGSYICGMDAEIIRHITSANIACGWHAGDPLIMQKTARECLRHGVGIGAHPGFPDLMGFGRRNLAVTPEEARAYTLYQLGALDALAREAAFLRSQSPVASDEGGVAGSVHPLHHVKLHGAFYNLAARDEKIADSVIDGIGSYDPNLIIVTLSGSYMARAARSRGLRVAEEVFADRGYHADGTLVARNHPGAFIRDRETAMRRVVTMAKEGKVATVDGKEMEIRADTVCVHGDNPEAVAFVIEIRRALEEAGVSVLPMNRFI